ncbi:MAG: MaoC/PaaZ C-terminal domain-containing protein [Solirubrobacteraceae bacterium]|jgi:acyl dehydratase
MSERALTRAPSLPALFGRAGAALVPGASRLPFVGGGGGAVPDRVLTLDGVAVDRARLAAYDRVCGFDTSDALPATYPHVLAFPLQLSLITAGDFPLPAIGLVHIANRIVVHRAIGAGERLDLRVWATALEPHPRGRQFTIRTEVRVGGELVWEESSTNLRRQGRAGGGRDGAPRDQQAEPPASATWRLPGDLGRRYGAVSGDLNPIHVHRLTARLFGFPSAIAHGMWTAARCLAALGPAATPGAGAAYAVDVSFRRPIVLPATVAFAEIAQDGGVAFAVRDAGRGTPHLEGRAAPLDTAVPAL